MNLDCGRVETYDFSCDSRRGSETTMFSRKFISAFMTAIVLACPLFDGGECCGTCSPDAVVEAAEAPSHEHGCGCSDGGEESPSFPGPGHDCPDGCHDSDCVCNGAVLPESTTCPDHRIVAIATCLVFSDCPALVQESAVSLEARGCHFPPLITGRRIRTIVASFLL